MTQIGELTKADMTVEGFTECPFDHADEPFKVTNRLAGDGGTLGESLANAHGTHTYQRTVPELDRRYEGEYAQPDDAIADPRTRGMSYVRIGGGNGLRYPVTSSAHHIIPAQASLKPHALLNYMCEGEKVSGDVGYDVNGCQNGIWLPGSYAVTDHPGGVGVWNEVSKYSSSKKSENYENFFRQYNSVPDGRPAQSIQPPPVDRFPIHPWPAARDDDGDHLPAQVPLPPRPDLADPTILLTGPNWVIHETNPKWCYVRASMELVGGQFHDSHVDYSEKIVAGGYLSKLKTLMDECHAMYVTGADGAPVCSACAKRYEQTGKVNPPYGLVGRLNAVSQSLGGYLLGAAAKNVFTSKWVEEAMKTIASNYASAEPQRAARSKRRREPTEHDSDARAVKTLRT